MHQSYKFTTPPSGSLRAAFFLLLLITITLSICTKVDAEQGANQEFSHKTGGTN